MENVKKPAAAVFGLLVLANVLAAAGPFGTDAVWDPDTRLTDNNYPDYTIQLGSQRHCVAVGPDGRVHVVWWVDNIELGQYFFQVYYKRYNPGSGWTPDTLISADLSSSRHSKWPSLAVDSVGRVHLVWVSSTSTTPYVFCRVYYKMCTPQGSGNAGWETNSTLVSNDVTVFKKLGADVACTPDSHVHVVWAEEYSASYTTYAIQYREKIGRVDTVWRDQFTVHGFDSDAKSWPAVAGSRNCDVHVAWHAVAPGISASQIWYRARVAGTWMLKPDNVSNAETEQTYPSVACNPATGDPHVAWRGLPAGGSTGRVVHSFRTAEGWQPPDTVSETGSTYQQYEPQLAFTKDGRGHAVWYGPSAGSPTQWRIRYSERCTTGVWSAAIELPTVPNYQYHPSISNGGNSGSPNDLHVVWEDYRAMYGEICYIHGMPAEPDPPMLISPANGATNVPGTGALVWHTAARALGYDAYLDTLNPPVMRVSENQPDTLYDYAGLAAGQTYYWQVTARNAAGRTPSEVWRFRVYGSGIAGPEPGLLPGPGFSLFPNPLTSGFATLRVQEFQGSRSQVANLRVYDALGRCVLVRQLVTGNCNLATPLDLRKVPAGVYLVRLDAESHIATQKLVVQR